MAGYPLHSCVQRVHQDLPHVDASIRAAVPVPDRYPADIGDAGVEVAGVRRDDALFDRGRRRDELHDRSRLVRIGCNRRPEQLCPRWVVAWSGEVVRRRRSRGENRPGRRLHHDDEAAGRLIGLNGARKLPFGNALNIAVQRQNHVGARDLRNQGFARDRDLPARRVALRQHDAGLPRQILVERQLEPAQTTAFNAGEAQDLGGGAALGIFARRQPL